MEWIIQQLLAASLTNRIGQETVQVEARGVEAAADWSSLKSPENYLGYERTEHFASPGRAVLNKPHSLLPSHNCNGINGRYRAIRQLENKPLS
jgi:hypothetical protein